MALYTIHCMTCHQSDGYGIAKQFPPLRGNAVVNADDPKPLIRAVLGGMKGVPIGGETYAGEMPSFRDAMSDEELAAVLTFIRSQWGNHAGPVTPEAVRAER